MSALFRFALAFAALILAPLTFQQTAGAQEDTLRVGVSFLPPARGAPHGNSGAHSIYTYDAIFDFLTDADDKGNVIPDLATSWTNTSPTTWEFKLRPGVKFTNGSTLTASDVARAVNFFHTEEGGATMNGGSVTAITTGARAIDDTTVEITTKGPNPALPSLIRIMFIYDFDAWEDLGKAQFSQTPVGSGPYKVTRWNPEDIELEAWGGAWKRPKIQKMRIIALPEASSRVQALLSDQIDLTPYLPIDAIPQVEAAGKAAEIFTTPNVVAWSFMGIYRDTPFKDQRVRQAANYAVNKQAIIDSLLRGSTVPAGQPATRQTFGYNPSIKAYPYNPEKAKALLAEAGYPNGFDMEAAIIPGIAPADTDIHQQMAQDLSAVGIRTNIKQQPFSEWLKAYFAKVPQEDFGKAWGENVYAFQLGITLDTAVDPAGRLTNPWSCARLGKPFWCNERETELLNMAGEEFDPEKRRQILQEFMAQFHEHAPVLFMFESVEVVGRAANVHNAKLIFRVFKYDQIEKRS